MKLGKVVTKIMSEGDKKTPAAKPTMQWTDATKPGFNYGAASPAEQKKYRDLAAKEQKK